MDNKEFGKQLENRTKLFAIEIIKLSTLLPYKEEGKVIRIKSRNPALALVQIIEKRTGQEVKLILEIK